jgi:glycosyltransferase involved in cell wall biosynthesis
MLNYEFPPLGGGAANANRHLLEEFADWNDLSIDLITSSPDSDKEVDFSDNIKIYKLDVSKRAVHHWTQSEIARYSIRALKQAKNLNNKNGYDLIHAWFGVPSGILARLMRTPYIVSLRGSDVPGYSERFSLQYVFLRPLLKHVWNQADAVIANSEGLRELARETADPGIEVIPNGVAVSNFSPRFEREGPLSVLCVARLIRRKGIGYLIDAVGDLENVTLTIVGEGEIEDELKTKVESQGLSSRVRFAGYVPHDDIHSYYEQADVFVLPSFNEGMSNTILEAMAAGLPILTTDTGGTDELLNGNGFVIEKPESNAIREALIHYRDNDRDRVEHAKKSRALAENMSWTSVAEQYYSIYERFG